MTNGFSSAGSLAGAALTIGLVGVTLGVTGQIVRGSQRQLRGRRRVARRVAPPRVFRQPRLLQTRRARFRRTGII